MPSPQQQHQRQKTPVQMAQFVHSSSNSPAPSNPDLTRQMQGQYFNGTESNGELMMNTGSSDMSADIDPAKAQYQAMLQQQQRQQFGMQMNGTTHSSPAGSQISSPVINNQTHFQHNSPILSQSMQQPGRVGVVPQQATFSPQQMAAMQKNLPYLNAQQQAAYHRLAAQVSTGPGASPISPSVQTLAAPTPPVVALSPMSPQQGQQGVPLTQAQFMQRQQAQQQRIQQQHQQHQQINQKEQEHLAQARLQNQQAPPQGGTLSQHPSPSHGNMRAADKFLKGLMDFMAQRNTPIQGMPIICGRQVHLLNLYGIVTKAGGYSAVNLSKSWGQVAGALGFNSPNDANAPLELAQAYNQLLFPFEEMLRNRQNQARNASQALRAQTSGETSQQNPPHINSPAMGNFRPTQTQPQAQIPLQPQVPNQSVLQYQQQQAQQVLQAQQAHQIQLMQAQEAARGQIPANSMSPHHRNFNSPSPTLNNGAAISHPLGTVTSRHQTPEVSRPQIAGSQQSTPAPRGNTTPLAGARSTSISRNETTNPEMPPPRQVASSPGALRKSDVRSKPATPVNKPLARLTQKDHKYLPKKRKLDSCGGYNIQEIGKFGSDVDTLAPDFPLFQELGAVEINAVIMALKSMIPGEVRQALDKLALLSSNHNVPIVLQECPGLATALGMLGLDLLNNLKEGKRIDTVGILKENAPGDEPADDEGEKDLISTIFNSYRNWDEQNDDLVVQIDSLTGEPVETVEDDETAIKALNECISADDKNFDKEVSPDSKPNLSAETDSFKFTHYLDLLQAAKEEAESLCDERKSSVNSFWQDALADRFLYVTLILRNLSFTDTNQPSLVRNSATLKFLFELTRAVATNENLVFTKRRRLCLQKDLVTLFANLGLYISIPSPADAFSVLLLMLSFAPDETPFKKSKDSQIPSLMFSEYSPKTHRYLGCAIDALAKLLPKDPPNRGFFKEIFLNTCADEEYLSLLHRHLAGRTLYPYEFLTRAFALAISTLPRSDFRSIPKALEIRRPLLQQSLLIAESLSSFIPAYGAHQDILAGLSSSHVPPSQYTESYNLVLTLQRSYNVAYEWLTASEGVGHTLLRAACALGTIYNPGAVRGRGEVNPFAKITQRSICILRALAQNAMKTELDAKEASSTENDDEKVNGLNDLVNSTEKVPKQATDTTLFPVKSIPTVEAILGAMLAGNMNDVVVRNLCEFMEKGTEFMSRKSKMEKQG